MNGQIPRGLMTRDGTPVKPTARLPSLRGDPLTSIASSSLSTPASLPLINHLSIAAGKAAAAAAASSSPNKTRGGATKRQFKPTIPSLQSGTSKARNQNQADNCEPEKKREPAAGRDGRGRGGANNHQKRGGREQIQKNYIQLESNVFTGINAAALQPQSGSKRQSGTSGSSSIGKVTIKKEPDLIRKGNDGKLKDLLNDQFIASSDDEDSDGEQKYSRLKPIGWDSLFFEDKDDKKPDSPPEPVGTGDVSPASVLQEDRILLIQLPEQLIPLTDDQLLSSEGYIGRIRIYASGRVDFVDDTRSENQDVFTCLRSDDAVTTIAIKDEHGREQLIDLKKDTPFSGTQQQEHVVFFDSQDKQAVSCGLLNPVEKLVIIPDSQPDMR